MRLIPRFNRKRDEQALEEFDAARREALERLRSRWRGDPEGSPESTAPTQSEDHSDAIADEQTTAAEADYAPPAAEESALNAAAADEPVDAIAPDFLLKSEAGGGPATEPPAEELADGDTDDLGLAPTEEEAADGDLLDIFRDAKNEVVENSLASEVDHVSIADLMKDLAGITVDLGVKPRVRATEPAPGPGEAHASATPVEEPLVRVEKVEPHTLDVPPVAEEGATEEIELLPEPDDSMIESLITDEVQQSAPEPLNEPVRRPEVRLSMPPKNGGGSLMHVLVVGLMLALASGAGMQAIQARDTLLAAGSQPTPAVLGVTENPVAIVRLATSTPTPRPTKKPTPTASPSPSPSPSASPSPTPTLPPLKQPRTLRNPAWFSYRVEYGDSLSSIAISDGLCPDHILWNNPGRQEDTPLFVNDRLLLPKQPGVIHTIAQGDTLKSISLLYNSSVDAIIGLPGNEISGDSDLVPGQELLVPGGIPQSAFDLDDEAWQLMRTPSQYGYVWPFYGQITTFYGEQRPGYVHRAIDVGGLGHYGVTVVASAEGTVVFVGEDINYGANVIIEHPDGSRTRYAHFSKIYVQQGQSVDRSQPVGALGCSGASTGTHLHFELWRAGEAVDPLEYLP